MTFKILQQYKNIWLEEFIPSLIHATLSSSLETNGKITFSPFHNFDSSDTLSVPI